MRGTSLYKLANCPTTTNNNINMKINTVVKKSKYGKGLFADQDIKHKKTRFVKDRVVVASFKYHTKTKRQWGEYLTQWQCIPTDSGVEMYDKFLFDPNLRSTGHTCPSWYRLNHSFKHANVKMVKYKDEIRWVTNQDIQKGEEIRFEYMYPDPAWCKED